CFSLWIHTSSIDRLVHVGVKTISDSYALRLHVRNFSLHKIWWVFFLARISHRVLVGHQSHFYFWIYKNKTRMNFSQGPFLIYLVDWFYRYDASCDGLGGGALLHDCSSGGGIYGGALCGNLLEGPHRKNFKWDVGGAFGFYRLFGLRRLQTS